MKNKKKTFTKKKKKLCNDWYFLSCLQNFLREKVYHVIISLSLWRINHFALFVSINFRKKCCQKGIPFGNNMYGTKININFTIIISSSIIIKKGEKGFFWLFLCCFIRFLKNSIIWTRIFRWVSKRNLN